MTDLDIMVPEEKDVVVSGKRYTVRKLSLEQNIRIMRLIGSLHDGTKASIAAEMESGKGDMGAILEKLAIEKTPELLRILLESKDEFPRISFEDFSDVAVAVTELNDFEKIFANFQMAAKNTKGIAEVVKNLLPSLPSSGK